MHALNLILLVCAFIPRTAFAYVGGLDSAGQFPATIMLRSVSGHGLCTAVKVSEHQVLTAAHCNLMHGFDAGARIYLLSYKGIASGNNFSDSEVKKIVLHPSFRPSTQENYSGPKDINAIADLAILEFDDLSFFGAAKISFRPVRANDRVVVGGFGLKGYDLPAWENLTLALKDVQKIFAQTFTVGLFDADGKRMSMGTPGDSGGPAYRQNSSNKEWEVVGINSAVVSNLHAFSEDPKTGAITHYLDPSNPKPLFYISRLGLNAGEDSLNVIDWLKENLPASSFAEP